MSDPRIRLVLPDSSAAGAPAVPLGRMMVDEGHISLSDLLATLGSQRQTDIPLGELLIARGLASEADVYRTLALQYQAQYVSAADSSPDLSLQMGTNPRDCLRLHAVPWSRIGNITCIACAAPDRWGEVRQTLPQSLFPVMMVVASLRDIEAAINSASQSALAAEAEARVPLALSCRSLPQAIKPILFLTGLALTGLLATGWATPSGLYAGLFLFATGMVFVGMLIKCAGAILHLVTREGPELKASDMPDKFPKISLLVPLFDESTILTDLLGRLTLLAYPKELMDVLLIVEEQDHTTRAHLDAALLPHWMRVIVVPAGQIQTKPRALNYALSFCRGSIIGIYDAEDAPHPNQLRDVVATFHAETEKTACVQAVLDFYNARSNAMARFFAIEYAAWFRLILPGVARLGFAVPLGGTSLFFRRSALEYLHGWDAHNVTEDADLGIRLARAGYRTVLISSVTLEEANNRIWPWIKQRSRWLKGYLITYLAHMRNPWRLLVELGPWKFIGFQAFFLSAISQYMLAPLIWSCMIMYYGWPHFIQAALPADRLHFLMMAFIATWIGSTLIYIIAITKPSHRHLIPWSFGMSVYMALGTLAIYKGAWELIKRPFYWDKTQHGVKSATTQSPPR